MGSRWLRATGALTLLAVSSLTGCALDPATWGAPLGGLTPEREIQVGREAAGEVEREIGLVEAPALVAYVRGVGERVARFSPRRDVVYQFQVADMAEPNAFALPGGYVYVSRGLLALTNSEDELANVIGHEIAHVAARHAAARQSRQAGVGLLAVLGTVAAAVLGGPEVAGVAGQIGQVAGAGVLASYSREQEREADRIGQEMAMRAGADPAAMASFLRHLETYSRLKEGGARMPTFLDSHPSNPERIAAAATLAATLAPHGVPGVREAHLARLDGLLLGADPAGGVLREGLFLHPDLGFALRFPSGWRVENRRSAVKAAAPRGDTEVYLQFHQGPGDDPRAAAEAFARAARLAFVESGPLAGTQLPAWRALAAVDSQQGRYALDLTWVAWRGSIYRLAGLTPAASYRSHRGSFAAVGRSFRPLRAGERAEIRAERLRLVAARAGETLTALVVRSDSVWNVQEVAAFNGLTTDVRLPAGTLVKVARSEPYVGP